MELSVGTDQWIPAQQAAQRVEQDAAARAAAEATRQKQLKDAADAVAKTGVRCQLAAAATGTVCAEPGAGRCRECHRVFCRHHRSADLGAAFWAAVDQCWECQERQVGAKAEQDRTEGERVAIARRAQVDERRRQEELARTRRRRAAAATRRGIRLRRIGTGLGGTLLVAAGAAAGQRVGDALVSATLPFGPIAGQPITAYLALAGLAVAASVVALLYATGLGAAAAMAGRLISIVGFVYLVAVAGVQLGDERAEPSWGPFVSALGGASAWLVGAHLAYRPVAQVRDRTYRGVAVSVVVVVLLAVAAGAAAFQVGARLR
jgi:hypothetical protein